jgi:hypothetical protein
MPLPGSWISATYLYYKLKPLNTILNSAEYTMTRERIFLFPKPHRCTQCNYQAVVCAGKRHKHRTPGRQGGPPGWRKMTQPGEFCW